MKILLATLSLIVLSTISHGAETVGEKVDATVNNAKRSVKSTVNRVDESICEKTDKNCLAKKAGNRVDETKGYAKDKASEAVNVMDNDDEAQTDSKKKAKKEKKYRTNRDEAKSQQNQ